MTLWIAIVAVAVLAGLWLAWPFWVRGKVEPNEADHAISIYRDQREELRRDARSGLISEVERDAAEQEIERRALRAARQLDAGVLVSRRSPGVAGLDIQDNVIPFVPKEEQKIQREAPKILGRFDGDRVTPLELPISATCTRVNVVDGHTEAVSASLGRRASLEEVAEAMRAFGREFSDLGLPSAPPRLISVSDDPYRP